jgi:hypothetical protein
MPAKISQRGTIVGRPLQLYNYDFSEFDGQDVNPHGEYLHRYFDEYWIDSDRKVFLRVEGALAGFALVYTGNHTTSLSFLSCANTVAAKSGRRLPRHCLISFQDSGQYGSN